jgi:hypothetical protein
MKLIYCKCNSCENRLLVRKINNLHDRILHFMYMYFHVQIIVKLSSWHLLEYAEFYRAILELKGPLCPGYVIIFISKKLSIFCVLYFQRVTHFPITLTFFFSCFFLAITIVIVVKYFYGSEILHYFVYILLPLWQMI